MERDLYVIGAGRLGRAVLREWRGAHPAARLTAETHSSPAPAEFANIAWRHRAQAGEARASYLLFCLPPSATDDYPAEARRAIGAWNGRGKAVLVSSTAVYAEDAGGWVTESSPTGHSERARRLLAAEEVFLEGGGTVVRLAGLYSSERGPHLAYAKLTTSPESGDGWLNLIEESDAARLCTFALEKGAPRTVYHGSDGSPLKRAALWRAVRGDLPAPFTGRGETGRRIDAINTRQALSWVPRFPHFVVPLVAK